VNTQKATLLDGTTVEYLPQMIGEGGMKQVFFTADKSSVLCFFKDQSTARDPNRMARLQAILTSYNPTVHPSVGAHFAQLFCWPTGIVIQPRLGVMTPTYAGNFFFSSGNLRGKEKEGRWFSSPKLRKMLAPGEVGDWLGYLQMCKRMARAVRKMHMTGLAHSDLSSKNVLVDPASGMCAIIDVDSLVVTGVYAPDVLGTPGYIAPEVLTTQRLALDDPNRKLPSNFTDLHALAVLIYEYLLYRHPLRGPKVNSTVSAEEDEFMSMGPKALFIENPHDTSNHWCKSKRYPPLRPEYDKLGRYLKTVIMRAFTEGLHEPTARPAAGDWETALYLTEDLLIPCGNTSCPAKWFVHVEREKPVCPWCGWRLKTPIPVVEFYYAPRPGQYRSEDHCMTCYDGRLFYKWHVYRGIKPVEGADTQPQAQVQYYDRTKQWLLWNRALDSMISPNGNPVPIGQPTVLQEGSEIVLSKDSTGRHISIRMIP